jgi:DNA helicase-2/ATP-dependent DNA helicase PcrA
MRPVTIPLQRCYRRSLHHFLERFTTQITKRYKPKLITYLRNYRSTSKIVKFVNNFSTLVNEFQKARVKDKPPLIPERSPPLNRIPLLGMFRPDVKTLAKDLSGFIHK